MKRFLLGAAAYLAMALLLQATRPALAQFEPGLDLHEVLAAALQRADARGPAVDGSGPYRASAWLAGVPSLGLTYLDSEQRLGTDEAELNINLPLKSSRRRSADRALEAMTAGLDENASQQRQLYFSGLIREALWSFRLADTRRRFAADKRRLLLELERREGDLLAAGATSEYALLLLQNELVAVDIALQEHLRESRGWLQRYRLLTGLENMPADISEPPLPLQRFEVGQHPRLRALELERDRRRQLLRANSALAANWNLSLTAKNFETAGYDEQQYGLGLEIPLSALDIASESDAAEFRALQREFLLARDELLNSLRAEWEQLIVEREFLQRKQQLLERSQQLSGRIGAQLGRLEASNEVTAEIVLRRKMEAVDTSAAVSVNRLLTEQNMAMLRQAAGQSL
jgi:hypothetical protein